MKVGNGLADVAGIQATRDDEALRVDDPFGQSPIEELARPGVGPVNQQKLGAVLFEPADVAVTGRKRFDGAAHPLSDPLGILDRLDPMELRGVEPYLVDDLDHPLGGFVSEHPDGEDMCGTALDDVGDLPGTHLPRRGGKYEAHRAGPQPGSQEGIGFGGDAAYLDEYPIGRLCDPATDH